MNVNTKSLTINYNRNFTNPTVFDIPLKTLQYNNYHEIKNTLRPETIVHTIRKQKITNQSVLSDQYE